MFHRLLMEPEGYLQGGSFRRFHDSFLIKTGTISAFLKFVGKYELSHELLTLLQMIMLSLIILTGISLP